MTYRKDALQAAVDIIASFRESTAAFGDSIRMTVGRFVVAPNSPNTIPGSATFSIDLRHPEDQIIESLARKLLAICDSMDGVGGCTASVTTTLDLKATEFSPDIMLATEAICSRRDLSYRYLASGAFHDAKFMAQMCPTGMIFVPCAGGLSHHPAESASARDLAAGAGVLAELMDLGAGREGQTGSAGTPDRIAVGSPDRNRP